MKIEIHDVRAHRVDADGRVRGIQVLGVAERRDCRLLVRLTPKDERLGPVASVDFGADATAAFVRPETVGWSPERVALRSSSSDERTQGPWLWVAEFDLDSTPQLPPVPLGVQPVPLCAEANCFAAGGQFSARPYVVAALALVAAYPVGVLFVHGIGVQTRSETLSQWTAPLLRTLNDWFEGCVRRAGERADAGDLDGWLASLLVQPDWNSYDEAASDRFRLATPFADAVAEKSYGSDRERLAHKARRALMSAAQRTLEPEEIAAGRRFAGRVRDELGVEVVGATAELADARLIDRDAPATQPSTVEVRLTQLSVDGEVARSSWLMSESHWAESFRPPPFAAFGAWCLRTAPVIWVHYFAMAFERSGRTWRRAVWSLVPLATAVLAMALAFVALMALAVIPWPRLRSALLSAQRTVAGVVGDSYVFVKDVVQRRAIVDRVRRDVEWLSQRCRKVVVVAHSQGAAAADQALNQPLEYQPRRLHALVTLGAGVQTLQRLAELSGRAAIVAAGWLALFGVALFWGGIVAALLGKALVASAGVAVLGAAVLLVAGAWAWIAHPGLSRVAVAAGSSKPWHDFFATHDPVPWGPIVSDAAGARHYRAHEVGNRSSFVTDHTTYWDNVEEVVVPVARLVAAAAGVSAVERSAPDADAVARLLADARRSRLRWLRAARWVALSCTAALCVSGRHSIARIAAWAKDLVAARLGWSLDAIAPFPGAAAVRDTLAVLAPYALYVTVVVAVWSAWSGAERRTILGAHGAVAARGWQLLFASALIATFVLTLLLARAGAPV